MGYIYKISNDINNKVYIGKTLASISERWKEHLSDMDKCRNEKRPLYAAMRKYGTSHFYIEEVEQCSNSIINERERYWIDFYGSYSNGYNATKGGDGKSYADVDAIITLWNEGKNIKEIFEITGHDHKTITKHLNDYEVTSQDIKNRGIECRSKSIVKIDKITGEIIEVFPSESEARRQGYSHAPDVANGKRKTDHGFYWKWLDN